MKTTLIALLAIASLGLIIPSYAEVVPLPTLPTDKWTGTDVQISYLSESSYVVSINVHYTIQSAFDVLNSISYTDTQGSIITIPVQDGYLEKFYPVEEIIVEETPRVNHEKLAAIIDKKRDETKLSEENGFSKLRQCLVEFKEEQPKRFAGWERTANLEEFDIPNQWQNDDHYDRAELEAQKRWVVCKMLKEYKFIGAYEANKVIDNSTSVTTETEYNDPRTDDVTEEQIATEAKRAEEYKCSTPGIQQGFCEGEFTGVNRGDPDGYYVPVTLEAWRQSLTSQSDSDTEEQKALLTQCNVYYPQYKHKVGTDQFPEWLGHCVP